MQQLHDKVGVRPDHRDGRFVSRQGVKICSNFKDRMSSEVQPSISANAPLAKRMLPSSAIASTGTGNRSSTTSAGSSLRRVIGDWLACRSRRRSTSVIIARPPVLVSTSAHDGSAKPRRALD